jgi:hypothetical protein
MTRTRSGTFNVRVWGIFWTVEGQYFPASRGYCEPGGLQIEPDEPERIEDMEIRVAGSDVDLFEHLHPKLLTAIEDAACKAAKERDE